MSEELQIKEKFALLLMSDSDDAKRLVLFLIYKIVEKNPGITVNQMSSLMKKFGVDKFKVETAVTALSSETLFNCISTWTEKKNVVHLRCKDSSFYNWISSFLEKVPEVENFDAPKFIARGINVK